MSVGFLFLPAERIPFTSCLRESVNLPKKRGSPTSDLHLLPFTLVITSREKDKYTNEKLYLWELFNH